MNHAELLKLSRTASTSVTSFSVLSLLTNGRLVLRTAAFAQHHVESVCCAKAQTVVKTSAGVFTVGNAAPPLLQLTLDPSSLPGQGGDSSGADRCALACRALHLYAKSCSGIGIC
eukprot:COSAG05_NODE_49_length_24373_cov_16.162561_14_plen_115_part_00